MGILDTIKALLGIGGSSTDRDRRSGGRETNVTVEKDRRQVDTESEAAVEGTDAAGEAEEPEDAPAAAATTASASTGSLLDEDAEGDEAAEPAEATLGSGAAEVDEAKEPDETDETDEPGETDETGEPDETEGTDAGATAVIEEAEAETGEAETGEPEVETGAEPEIEEESEPETGESVEAGTGEDERESEAAGESVETIKGIGPAYAGRLAEVDIRSVGDLAAADAAEVAEAIDVSETRVSRWVARARDR